MKVLFSKKVRIAIALSLVIFTIVLFFIPAISYSKSTGYTFNRSLLEGLQDPYTTANTIGIFLTRYILAIILSIFVFVVSFKRADVIILDFIIFFVYTIVFQDQIWLLKESYIIHMSAAIPISIILCVFIAVYALLYHIFTHSKKFATSNLTPIISDEGKVD